MFSLRDVLIACNRRILCSESQICDKEKRFFKILAKIHLFLMFITKVESDEQTWIQFLLILLKIMHGNGHKKDVASSASIIDSESNHDVPRDANCS